MDTLPHREGSGSVLSPHVGTPRIPNNQQAGVTSPGTYRPPVPVLHVGHMLYQLYKFNIHRDSPAPVATVPVPVRSSCSWRGPVLMFLGPLRRRMCVQIVDMGHG